MPDSHQDDQTVEHQRVPAGPSTRDAAELLAAIEKRAPDPKVFEQHPPVFFDAEVSSRRVDSYDTVMMPSSLRNYAEDAGKDVGVAFQDSHKYDGMVRTLGRSVEGRFVQGRGEEHPARTLVTFFTQPTLSPLMAEFHDRMRSGLAADVSIGFSGGKTICSICGKEMFSWWSYSSRDDDPCWHFPGVEYDLTGKDGKPTGAREIALGQIEDAHLSEVSTVFDGATPGAAIIGIKARAAHQRGMLSEEARRAIEQRWQIDLATGRRLFLPESFTSATIPIPELLRATGAGAGALASDPSSQEERTMATFTQEELDQAVAAARGQERERALAPVLAAIRGTGIAIEDEGDLATPVRALQSKIAELTPRAKDGDTYRDDLIAQVCEEGVRVWGNAFDKEAETADLRALAIASIKRRLAHYKPLADDIFKDGRGTEDGDGPVVKPDTEREEISSRRRRRGAPSY